MWDVGHKSTEARKARNAFTNTSPSPRADRACNRDASGYNSKIPPWINQKRKKEGYFAHCSSDLKQKVQPASTAQSQAVSSE